jgi:hypothetical protein
MSKAVRFGRYSVMVVRVSRASWPSGFRERWREVRFGQEREMRMIAPGERRQPWETKVVTFGQE